MVLASRPGEDYREPMNMGIENTIKTLNYLDDVQKGINEGRLHIQVQDKSPGDQGTARLEIVSPFLYFPVSIPAPVTPQLTAAIQGKKPSVNWEEDTAVMSWKGGPLRKFVVYGSYGSPYSTPLPPAPRKPVAACMAALG